MAREASRQAPIQNRMSWHVWVTYMSQQWGFMRLSAKGIQWWMGWCGCCVQGWRSRRPWTFSCLLLCGRGGSGLRLSLERGIPSETHRYWCILWYYVRLWGHLCGDWGVRDTDNISQQWFVCWCRRSVFSVWPTSHTWVRLGARDIPSETVTIIWAHRCLGPFEYLCVTIQFWYRTAKEIL